MQAKAVSRAFMVLLLLTAASSSVNVLAAGRLVILIDSIQLPIISIGKTKYQKSPLVNMSPKGLMWIYRLF
ncbi:hypothetical protein GV64_16555 [Endozoicomonas elysicola]|uniref:Uncharacterized protein n=1 Tax=Endozoicomonas elysicola TaxID=305900 RepID=A0A081KD99_9GAMM|nr:hypothetical protein GV64_16555 [Endozoicomonas elysicola]